MSGGVCPDTLVVVFPILIAAANSLPGSPGTVVSVIVDVAAMLELSRFWLHLRSERPPRPHSVGRVLRFELTLVQCIL